MLTQEIQWQQMSAEEFADFERIQGQSLIKVNEVFWRRVRPSFYRPLLMFREYPSESVAPPWSSRLGGFQHAVPPQETSNSFLNMLIFGDTQAYSLESLDWNRRKQVKLARKEFVIRPMHDVNEFKQKAYAVYLSFYKRTRYKYKSERRYKDRFSCWADSLFRTAKIVVLGAYRGADLGGVCVTQWVEDTLMYSTVFCDTASLKMHVTSLMLHSVRTAVAGYKQVKQIFAGPYKYEPGKGVDDFYLVRGCKLVAKAASLYINPLATIVLRRCACKEYARLCGKVDAVGES
jgi:hypothetical protein